MTISEETSEPALTLLLIAPRCATLPENSTYHGMAVQLNKRFSNNFQFLAGYTLGRVLDDRPEAINFNPGGPMMLFFSLIPSTRLPTAVRASRTPVTVLF